MLALILASHVNHVASTITISKPNPESSLKESTLSDSPKPRELHRKHRRRHHKRRRHMRHNKNSLQMTRPYTMNPVMNPQMMVPMGYAYQNNLNLQGHRHLFDLGGALGSVTGGLGNAVGGAASSLGNAVGGAASAIGGGAGQAVEGVGEGAGEAVEGAGEGAGGLLGGIGGALGSVGGAVDSVGDNVGSALGMGDNAGTGLAVGAAAAGAGYMMRKRRQKIHAAKVRMLDQKIAMKEFQSNLVDQEYQLLLHANRDLHAANGRISNLERNAVYRINARILDYAIGAYY